MSKGLRAHQRLSSPSTYLGTSNAQKTITLSLDHRKCGTENVVGSMLAQEDNDKNEWVMYYLSKRFHDYETRYTPIEKLCIALVQAMQKFRHIILPFQIWVVARIDHLKYLFEKPALSGRLSRWLILLAEFDLKYVARKTIKGSVVSEI